MKFHPHHASELVAEAASILNSDESDAMKIHRLWVTIAQTKARHLGQQLREAVGDKVQSGPFQGMALTEDAFTGLYGFYLSGSYEKELQPIIEQRCKQPYDVVLNIGCALGYYATGLAMRMPHAKVKAFDIDEKEQARCRAMAALNNVSDRVSVSGLFHGDDFASYADQKTLVVMDIEGGEVALLDPLAYPALTSMDIIVELHDALQAGISQKIMARFAATHDIRLVPNSASLFDFTPYIGTAYIDPFESLILNWENRDGPTPWAVMTII